MSGSLYETRHWLRHLDRRVNHAAGKAGCRLHRFCLFADWWYRVATR